MKKKQKVKAVRTKDEQWTDEDCGVDEWIEDQSLLKFGLFDNGLSQNLRQMAKELLRRGYDKGWEDCAKKSG